MNKDRLAATADKLGVVFFFLLPIGPVIFAILQIISISGGGFYFILALLWIAVCAIGVCVAYFLDKMASRHARSTPHLSNS